MKGAEALSDVQMNGIKVDVSYCKKAFMDLQKEVKDKKSLKLHFGNAKRTPQSFA